MEQVTTIGLDLAKNVFQLHGVDAAGNAFSNRLHRDRRRFIGMGEPPDLDDKVARRHFVPLRPQERIDVSILGKPETTNKRAAVTALPSSRVSRAPRFRIFVPIYCAVRPR